MEDFERTEEWKEFVRHTREHTVAMIENSAIVMSIATDEPDIKWAVELGLAIHMDKPLIVMAQPGQVISEKLRRVADKVVIGDLDIEADQRLLEEALRELLGDAPGKPQERA